MSPRSGAVWASVRLRTRSRCTSPPAAPLSAVGLALHERFVNALDDDLDLPAALALVREAVRSALPPDERRWLVLDADFVLGLDLDLAVESRTDEPSLVLPDEVQALADARSVARAARDFATADRIRSELGDRGYSVIDGPDGQVIERR